jgi:hypothetical protein
VLLPLTVQPTDGSEGEKPDCALYYASEAATDSIDPFARSRRLFLNSLEVQLRRIILARSDASEFAPLPS